LTRKGTVEQGTRNKERRSIWLPTANAYPQFFRPCQLYQPVNFQLFKTTRPKFA